MFRYVYDTTLTGRRQRVVADFIAQCGLANAALRDEIYTQLCNLTFPRPPAGDQSSTVQRTWQLMAHCLSCFKPSNTFRNYLLKYVAIYLFRPICSETTITILVTKVQVHELDKKTNKLALTIAHNRPLYKHQN